MSPPDGPKPDSRSSLRDAAARSTRETVERSTLLVEALLGRALRHERVLEVLDLRAARSARTLAERVRTATQRWVATYDAAARHEAGVELEELLEAAEMVLLLGDAPVPSTERPAQPDSSVEPASEIVTEERAAVSDDSPTPKGSDQSAWLSVLGVPRRRR